MIGSYEAGEYEPDLATFEAIAVACKVDPVWLVFGKPGEGDPLALATVEGHKDDRLFAWTFHEAARLLSEEGLQGDLAFTVRYARKFMNTVKRGTDDVEAKEIIRRAIESERTKIRSHLEKFRNSI